MSTEIEKLHAVRKEFEKRYEKTMKKVQSKCKHLVVAHWNGFSSGSVMHPVRVCMDCGIEEKGGWWCYDLNCSHWHLDPNYINGITVKTVLGPKEGRLFLPQSFDETMKLRP